MPVNMLKTLKIDNFKSLMSTTVELSKNTFLIGINGSGKTTILQAIDFLSSVVEGNVEQWLELRGWAKKDLTFSGYNKKLIEYKVDFILSNKSYRWEFMLNRDLLRCTSEAISCNDDKRLLIEVKDGRYSVGEIQKEKINFNYSGSILSAVKDEALKDELIAIRTFFKNIRSAELLSPILMKKRARHARGDIGLGGEKLSAFIDELTLDKKNTLKHELKQFFPKVGGFDIRPLKGGWKDLSLRENFDNNAIKIDARHLSDGVLRVMAILSQLLSTESVLLFDEIEDGVNQELIQELVNTLLNSSHQTIVATHSPLLLNYLDDEIAKESMLFVYRQNDGVTKTTNFYKAIKEFQKIDAKQFELFGPGEIMQSIDLIEFSQYLASRSME